MGLTDNELVEESLKGNYDAFAELVHKYSNLVYSVAVSKTRDLYHSEDIAQEVFVKAWMKLSHLAEGEKFSSWLITIATNQCTDSLRRKMRLKEESIVQEFPITYVPSPLKDLIWDAIDQLEEKYRIVVIMNYLSGYTAKEIANLLDISLSAIESRLRRARKMLKKELLKDMADTFGEKRMGKEFEEEVMWRIIPRIATIEIPVTNIEQSVAWYGKFLGTKAAFQDEKSAMLHLQGGRRVGVPTLYLVQTEDPGRLFFINTHTGIIHSIIDFFIHDLEKFHSFLKQEGVKVTDLNIFPGSTKGGFGFEDPDGNLLSACNVTHFGQE